MTRKKTCTGPCGRTLDETEENFYFRTRGGKKESSPYCKPCEKEKSAKGRRDSYATKSGKEKISGQNKDWRDGNPDWAERKRIKQNEKYALDEDFRTERKELSRQWRVLNPERKKELGAAWSRKNRTRLREEWNERFRTDPAFRLRNNLRHAIWEALTTHGGHKGGRSILKYLPYTMLELVAHLEALWEPWMSWDNYGVLDPERRTWQIDHVIPQVLFPYADFDDPNFLKCWSLSNLRPLESSLNVSKGCR